MDVPDRLPYEVLHRIYADDGPALREYHEPGKVDLVVASKKSGTLRPFMRVDPTDLLLYQALTDRLATAIDAALPPPELAGAYRQDTGSDSDAFAGSLTYDAWTAGVSSAIGAAGDAYILQTDISGYFLGVRYKRLRNVLLEAGGPSDVVDDLGDLLRAWEVLGVRGLPQGLRPSSPLGNVYLASLDRRLGALEVPFYRWVDDMWAICESFADARRIQDEIEHHLYDIGLTLNGEKTRILKASTAINRLEPAVARFERQRAALADGMVVTVETDYGEQEWVPDPEDLDEDLTVEKYQELVATLDDESLPQAFRPDMGLVYRKLEALRNPVGVATVPYVLRRAPDLADLALRYVVNTAELTDAGISRSVFETVLTGRHGEGRESERLSACHRILSLPCNDSLSFADSLQRLALEDGHPLVRAKAVVAWGRHTPPDRTDVIERFLRAAEPRWRPYALVAAQEKDPERRGALYGRWAGSGELRVLAETLERHPIRWSKL